MYYLKTYSIQKAPKQEIMTIEERDTARAIQAIARKLREPSRFDWEQERYELAKQIYIARLTLPPERMCLSEEGDMEIAIDLANGFIETYHRLNKSH